MSSHVLHQQWERKKRFAWHAKHIQIHTFLVQGVEALCWALAENIFHSSDKSVTSNSNNNGSGHDCSLSVATPTTLLPREQMQSLRHAPHRLGPPDRPGRRTFNAVFSLRWDAFQAVVSPLLLLAGDNELNPGPNC